MSFSEAITQHLQSRVLLTDKRFTPRAVKAMLLACDEADAKGLEFVGVEEVLSALITEGTIKSHIGSGLSSAIRRKLDGEI